MFAAIRDSRFRAAKLLTTIFARYNAKYGLDRTWGTFTRGGREQTSVRHTSSSAPFPTQCCEASRCVMTIALSDMLTLRMFRGHFLEPKKKSCFLYVPIRNAMKIDVSCPTIPEKVRPRSPPFCIFNLRSYFHVLRLFQKSLR